MSVTVRNVVATVTLPYLPPATLAKNTRCHWRTRHADFQDVKNYAIGLLWEYIHNPTWPYAVLTMHITWYQAGRQPDADAVLARCSAIMDAAEAVHLVADDAHIEMGSIRRIRVAHKDEQRVVVEFREGGAE